MVEGKTMIITDVTLKRSFNCNAGSTSNPTACYNNNQENDRYVSIVTYSEQVGTTTASKTDYFGEAGGFNNETVLSAVSGDGCWSRTNFFIVPPGTNYTVYMDGPGQIVKWIEYSEDGDPNQYEWRPGDKKIAGIKYAPKSKKKSKVKKSR
jgi:hypothetical protein